MLWIALFLPQCPLQALRWSEPSLLTTQPLAVAEQHRLVGANRAAHAHGVRLGQSSATALALLPQLRLVPRDAAREHACIAQLTLALAALTPHLCPREGGVLIEVQASLRLFGGARRLLRRSRALAHAIGLEVRLGCAPTAHAAWLLACAPVARRRCLRLASCARLLDLVPVTELSGLIELRTTQMSVLASLGVHTLGALRALPREGLQRRFGPALALTLDRAYGLSPDPRRWFEAPESFVLHRELLQSTDHAAVLTAAVDTLMPILAGWLRLRWQAASVLQLRLAHGPSRHEQPSDTVLRLALSTPSRDPDHLALLWRERLQRLRLQAPVYALTLALEAGVAQEEQPGELLPQAGTSSAGQAALLDRLLARLGADRVQRWHPRPDHRPERAQHALPVHIPIVPAPVSTERALPRPTWLLPRPLPLSIDAHGRPLHDGRRLHLRSRAERIESGWFDGEPVRRDYHVAEGEDHRLRWIYREHRADALGGWFLHGWFG